MHMHLQVVIEICLQDSFFYVNYSMYSQYIASNMSLGKEEKNRSESAS